jgi:uncharacterized protein YjbJ (UPF0337 family)
MNKDQFKGRTKQAKGKVKEVSGKIFNDKQLEKKGQAQKIVGRIQASYGDFKDEIQSLSDHENDNQKYD